MTSGHQRDELDADGEVPSAPRRSAAAKKAAATASWQGSWSRVPHTSPFGSQARSEADGEAPTDDAGQTGSAAPSAPTAPITIAAHAKPPATLATATSATAAADSGARGAAMRPTLLKRTRPVAGNGRADVDGGARRAAIVDPSSTAGTSSAVRTSVGPTPRTALGPTPLAPTAAAPHVGVRSRRSVGVIVGAAVLLAGGVTAGFVAGRSKDPAPDATPASAAPPLSAARAVDDVLPTEVLPTAVTASGVATAQSAAETTLSPTTTVAPVTTLSPATSVAPVTTVAAAAPKASARPAPPLAPIDDPVADLSADRRPLRYAVYSNGTLYLRGFVPSPEIAEKVRTRAASVLGAGNVVVEYAIDPQAALPPSGPVYVADTVLFASGETTLGANATPLLDIGVALLTLYPKVTITARGYTDDVGEDGYNLRLATRRLETIAAYVSAKGGDVARLRLEPKGEADPVADNATPEGRALNRRVEFEIYDLLQDG